MVAEKKEIVWLDYARFVGIFLVVLGHSLQRIPNWDSIEVIRMSYDYIYLFHMPLFFVVSGYLFKNEVIKKVYRGGVKILYSLIVPYLLYQLLYLPIAFWSYRNQFVFSVLVPKLLLGIAAGDGYKTPFSLPVCLPCWFIISIIQLRALFLFVPINKKTSLALTLFSIGFLLLRRYLGFDLYFCVDSTIMAIPYFLFGHYLKRSFDGVEKVSGWWLVGGAIAMGILVWLVLKYNGAAQMNGPGYGKNVIANYVAGCSGSIMAFLFAALFSKMIGARSIVRRVSRNTLFIIFSHWFILVVLGKVLFKLWFSCTLLNVVIAIFTSVVVLLISNVFIKILSERIPVLFGKLKYNKV